MLPRQRILNDDSKRLNITVQLLHQRFSKEKTKINSINLDSINDIDREGNC